MQVKEDGFGASFGRTRLAAAFALTLVCVASPSRAQMAVTASGTPSYSVALPVPPGIAGMAPNLNLVYTGGSVNGPAGVGWTLQGISVITRCAGNRLLDGKSIAINYTSADRLCLDGQRLIQTNASGVPLAATPAANGALLDAAGHDENGSYTEYRTEKDVYSRIRAYGGANGSSYYGPRYFKVWTKAGQVYEYGAGPSADPATTNALIELANSTTPSAWAVARISDTAGNYVDFKYSLRGLLWGSSSQNGLNVIPYGAYEWNLAEVQYTGNGSQVATNRVVLEYADRVDTPGSAQDRSESWSGVYKSISIARLKTVREYVNWPAATGSAGAATNTDGSLKAVPSTAVKVRAWKLGYELGPTTSRSRLVSVQECVGAAETTCMQPTSFQYAPNPVNESYTPSASFAASALATLQLEKSDGSVGVLLGDFNGDGRTDIFRWTDDPSQNALYSSNGDGTFKKETLTGLTGVNLFKSDKCYSSIAMDFNGDGKTDILRVMQPTSSGSSPYSCGTIANVLYLSKGNGTFTAVPLPASTDFSQIQQVVTSTPGGGGAATRTLGKNFYIIDLNGDGIPDIITTTSPAVSQSVMLNDDTGCGVCSRVYIGSASGTFTEFTGTNIATHSLYGPPATANPNQRWQPFVQDFNHDGLPDLQVESAWWWISTGDGNLTRTPGVVQPCLWPIDFNGDGRMDCLYAGTGSNSLAIFTTSSALNVANFNVTGVYGSTTQLAGTGIGFITADLDNDGRTDLIRWEDDPTKNVAYMSNGDGTFRVSSLFNLNTAAYALKKSDGSIDFVTGDFTGHGDVEILRTISSITAGNAATTNQLFLKASNTPPEQLLSVTDPSGLTSKLTYVTLPSSSSGSLGARYQSADAMGLVTSYPKFNLTLPVWLVATVESDTGVGTATIKHEYAYGGLRASFDGSGPLGFAQISEQNTAPDGSPLTTVTSYHQDLPYVGVADVSQTLDGALNQPTASMISRTTNAYCDTTSTATPSPIGTPGVVQAACATSSLVKRPYLYQSFEEGRDIDGQRTTLPTVTTTSTFNSSGDATQIVATTRGTSAGVQQTVTRTTSNTFFPDNTAGDAWTLGRLQSSVQTNTVPNVLASVTTQAGSSPTAAATKGSGPVTAPPVSIAALLQPILSLLLSD